MKIKWEKENIISYTWGIRLAHFVKKMEKVAHPEIDGFGKITIRDGELQGIWEEEFIQEYELDYYYDIFSWLIKLDFVSP